MTKEELKTKYGRHCDIDALIKTMSSLLTKYEHKNSEVGICEALRIYFEDKSDLIELFERSPHYIGDMRILADINIEREIDSTAIMNSVRDFKTRIERDNTLLSVKNKDGKTLDELLATGKSFLNLKDITDEDLKSASENALSVRGKFTEDGYTLESAMKRRKGVDAVTKFEYLACSVLPDSAEDKEIGLVPGMKTSRAFNRVCTHYGFTDTKDYNKRFAEYADLIAGGTRHMKLYISLNPLDYLTMSFGKSWASCHTIDKTNKRHMPNHYSGSYCGGTLSYMLDSCSFITFIHNSVPDDIVTEGKIYRNMFHFDKENYVLIQGRVYPQGNDGATDLYKTIRNSVQKELSACLGQTEDKWVRRTSFAADIQSEGAHYRDYDCFRNNCVESYLRCNDIPRLFSKTIGHTGVCLRCGETYTRSGGLSHAVCTSDLSERETTALGA